MAATDHDGQRYCLVDTAIGACGVGWSERGVTRMQLPEADRGATESRLRRFTRSQEAHAPPPPVAAVVADLVRYLRGDKIDFTPVALDLADVDPFYRKVYDAARGVGWGQTASYGDIARAAGSPGAARAVGQALGRNPCAIIVPCHRILAAGKRVGGFSAFGGTTVKARLLALEGVSAGNDLPLFKD
jgi:methylated-DNA-[protein]-cysteine S-methyltransferase